MFKYALFIFFICSANNSEAQKNILAPNEYVSIKFFNEFLDSLKLYVNQYPTVLVDSSNENEDSVKANKLKYLEAIQKDTAKAKAILNTFFILNDGNVNKTDTSKLTGKLLEFYSSFNKENINFLKVKPLRFISDKYVYDRLTKFQKENTFVLVDNRKPEKILYYLLIIPTSALKSIESTPKFLSWELIYVNGNFYFQDLWGNYGLETLF